MSVGFTQMVFNPVECERAAYVDNNGNLVAGIKGRSSLAMNIEYGFLPTFETLDDSGLYVDFQTGEIEETAYAPERIDFRKYICCRGLILVISDPVTAGQLSGALSAILNYEINVADGRRLTIAFEPVCVVRQKGEMDSYAVVMYINNRELDTADEKFCGVCGAELRMLFV